MDIGISSLSRRSFAALGLLAFAGVGIAGRDALASSASSAADGKDAAANGSAKADAATKFDPNDPKTVFVSPEWVKSVIDGDQDASDNYVLLEVAWGEEADDTAYGEGHLPGAVHLNTDYVEEDQFWNYRTPEEFTDLFKDYGITKDTTLILYVSSVTNSADDRVAVAALWAGVENVKVLDGGYEAWTKAGYDVETASNAPTPTDEDFGVEIPARPEYILTIDQVKDKLANDKDFKLVSIRSYAEFCGETSGYSYIDRAGEPEGAIWGHDTDDGSYATDEGATVGVDVLNEYLADSDASTDDELCFYCGTGWRAAIPFLICYQAGVKDFALYDGGWFQWQMDDDNPVQVGDPATGDVTYMTVGTLSTDKAVKN